MKKDKEIKRYKQEQYQKILEEEKQNISVDVTNNNDTQIDVIQAFSPIGQSDIIKDPFGYK